MTYLVSTTHRLPTGTLTLNTSDDSGALLSVQARNNPKRGFLFVSKVLGKHLAVPLADMQKSYAQLVDKLAVLEDGAVLVIGMAETATQLGYGVWDELQQRDNARICFYLHTTRYKTSSDARGFEESHSHAPSQWIQGLDNPLLGSVRSVVLVDDELSTGKTFEALEKVVRQALPKVEQVQWACLTDFRPDVYRTKDAVSLLQGEWAFEWGQTPSHVPAGEGQAVDPAHLPVDFGRRIPLTRAREQHLLRKAWARMEEELPYRSVGQEVLVLGSGEFMPFAFKMAQWFERQGKDVLFQATTRSPAMMERVELGTDHYNEGVGQYLYNYDRTKFDSVFLFLETDVRECAEELSHALGAHVINVQGWDFRV